MECEHKDTKRGLNIPRRYGSYRSAVCKSCGAFRALDHHGNIVAGWRGDWRPASEYAAATEPMELD